LDKKIVLESTEMSISLTGDRQFVPQGHSTEIFAADGLFVKNGDNRAVVQLYTAGIAAVVADAALVQCQPSIGVPCPAVVRADQYLRAITAFDGLAINDVFLLGKIRLDHAVAIYAVAVGQ